MSIFKKAAEALGLSIADVKRIAIKIPKYNVANIYGTEAVLVRKEQYIKCDYLIVTWGNVYIFLK